MRQEGLVQGPRHVRFARRLRERVRSVLAGEHCEGGGWGFVLTITRRVSIVRGVGAGRVFEGREEKRVGFVFSIGR